MKKGNYSFGKDYEQKNYECNIALFVALLLVDRILDAFNSLTSSFLLKLVSEFCLGLDLVLDFQNSQNILLFFDQNYILVKSVFPRVILCVSFN